MLDEILPRGGPAGELLLTVDDVHLSFAGVKAIDGVSLRVANG